MFLPQRVFPRPAVFSYALIIVAIFLLGIGQAVAQDSSIGLSGIGTLQIQPGNLWFGNVSLGNWKSLSATLSNTGTEKLTISSINNAANGFSVSGLTLPFTLYAGKSASITVTFTPTRTGTVNQDVSFISSASNGTIYVHLHGTGTSGSGALTANPTSQNFGNVQVGSSKTLSQTLTNSSSAGVTISSATITGSAFAINGLTVPLTLSAGQSITFNVVFRPRSSGSATGSITVVNNSSVSNLSIPLSGTGTAAGTLAVSPASLSFGNVTLGTAKSLTGTLSASGSSVTVSSVTVNDPEFVVTGLTFPFTLSSGQSSTFTVKFTPQASGSASATASFASNASNTPAVQSLSGTGISPTQHSVSLTWDPSTSTVNGYNIYRGGTAGGPYTKINSSLDPSTNYVDNTVQNGKTYYYVTTAVNSAGKESAYSNEVKTVIP